MGGEETRSRCRAALFLQRRLAPRTRNPNLSIQSSRIFWSADPRYLYLSICDCFSSRRNHVNASRTCCFRLFFARRAKKKSRKKPLENPPKTQLPEARARQRRSTPEKTCLSLSRFFYTTITLLRDHERTSRAEKEKGAARAPLEKSREARRRLFSGGRGGKNYGERKRKRTKRSTRNTKNHPPSPLPLKACAAWRQRPRERRARPSARGRRAAGTRPRRSA